MISFGGLFRTKTIQPEKGAGSPRSLSTSTRQNSVFTRTTISSRHNSAADSQIRLNGHTIYLIRHGEKPPKIDGEDQIGLSDEGKLRAEGLVDVFGKKSGYNIGCIFAQQYKPNGKRRRPYETVFPLSLDLGIPIDTGIERDDIKGIAEAVKAYKGPGNVVVCWENNAMNKIIEKLGVAGKFVYPKKRFDVIWTVKAPYKELHSWTSEQIECLDEMHRDPQ